MKRSLFFTLVMLLLAGCSGLPFSIPFLQTPAPAAPPQPTATPYSLPPLQPSNTPDLFALNTEGPTTDPLTGTPLVTNTAVPTFTPTFRPTITLEPLDPTSYSFAQHLSQCAEKYQSDCLGRNMCRGQINPFYCPGPAGSQAALCHPVVPPAGQIQLPQHRMGSRRDHE